MDNGRVPDGTGLSQAEPKEGLGPTGFDPSRMDDTDWHVRAQDVANYWSHPEDRAIAYQAAAEAIRPLRAELERLDDDRHSTAVSYWRDGEWLAGDGLARLTEAVGSIVSMCADSRDVFPDYQTSFVAVTEAVNELYGCIEDGVFTRDSDRNPEGEKPQALSAEHESAGRQASPNPSPDSPHG